MQIENERHMQLTMVKLPFFLNILMNGLILSTHFSNNVLFFCSIIHMNEYKFY